jgi:hypothetical protein
MAVPHTVPLTSWRVHELCPSRRALGRAWWRVRCRPAEFVMCLRLDTHSMRCAALAVVQQRTGTGTVLSILSILRLYSVL